MEESGRINFTMTAREYELFKEAKRRAASEKQAIVLRPRQAPAEASKEPIPVSDRGSKRKQPEGFPQVPYREPDLGAPSIGEYDGSKDPEDHLRKFKNAALLHQYSDAVKCQVFLNTLSGSALKWFDGLPQGSITCFLDFKMTFLRRFASSKKYQKTDHCLFTLKQEPTEPLRSYINRFNKVAQDVPIATSEILMSAFSHGLGEREFFRDLIKNLARNFDEMVEKIACYIKVEEAQVAQRKAERPPPSANKPERRVPQPPPQPLPRAGEARPTFHLGPEVRLAPAS
ncbi:uncharacterized protein LOC122004305 [Zingiber officinale]|uniref:uncharacterized protein LOC122004305 n=1 Tax=Zingiber officinale TaxID=94328 RepID=UPI001C4C3CC1|nr:uncharacterized protein LOC122004305 [Zingiber officinale]